MRRRMVWVRSVPAARRNRPERIRMRRSRRIRVQRTHVPQGRSRVKRMTRRKLDAGNRRHVPKPLRGYRNLRRSFRNRSRMRRSRMSRVDFRNVQRTHCRKRRLLARMTRRNGRRRRVRIHRLLWIPEPFRMRWRRRFPREERLQPRHVFQQPQRNRNRHHGRRERVRMRLRRSRRMIRRSDWRERRRRRWRGGRYPLLLLLRNGIGNHILERPVKRWHRIRGRTGVNGWRQENCRSEFTLGDSRV